MVVPVVLGFAGPAQAATSFGADLTTGSSGFHSYCSDWGATQPCVTVVTGRNDGTSAAAPVSGVLVSIALRVSNPYVGRPRVLHDPGGHPTAAAFEPLVFAAAGPSITVVGDGAAHSYPTRLPIAAGDLLGFSSADGAPIRAQPCPATCGRAYQEGSDGSTTTEEGYFASNYQAPISGVIEPDADGDGYGDETQDQCPTDASTQGPCPAPQPPPGGQPPASPGAADTTPPVLSSYVLSPASFVAANAGPSIVAAATVGTTVVYKLSEPATTTFTIEQGTVGHKNAGRCRAGAPRRGQKRCTRYTPRRGSIVRTGDAGLSSFRFMGRLRGKSLERGRYRLIALAVDSAGNKSTPLRRPFRILH